MQHAVCNVIRRKDSSAIKFHRVEIAFVLAVFHYTAVYSTLHCSEVYTTLH